MRFINITKKFDEKIIFEHFSADITEGKVTAIMGASGVGKSTLANILCGLTTYSGAVVSDGKISMVFGEPALLANLTVEKNLDYAVKHVIKDKTSRCEAIERALTAVELYDERKKYPHELSTGMAQRVALARAFIYPSRYIVLDEPFRGLDLGVKRRLGAYLKKLLSEDCRTTILITHDVDETLLFADNVIVLSGSPAEIVYKNEINEDNPERVRESLTSILGD